MPDLSVDIILRKYQSFFKKTESEKLADHFADFKKQVSRKKRLPSAFETHHLQIVSSL
jgi:hypothetical protein